MEILKSVAFDLVDVSLIMSDYYDFYQIADPIGGLSK